MTPYLTELVTNPEQTIPSPTNTPFVLVGEFTDHLGTSVWIGIDYDEYVWTASGLYAPFQSLWTNIDPTRIPALLEELVDCALVDLHEIGPVM